MRKRIQWTLILCLLPVIVGVTEYIASDSVTGSSVDRLCLLVPDNVGANNPIVREWMDAAAEEGLHLGLLHDSEFLNPLQRSKPIAGLIVPDSIHREANATLIGALHAYAHDGGNLMIVYDACTWDLDKHFAPVESRLSDLVGVSYAMYDRYTTDSIHWSSVWGDAETMKELSIPPGKYVTAGSAFYTRVHTVALAGSPRDQQPKRGQLVLSRYEFGTLTYPAFRTGDTFDGNVLLYTGAGIGAGLHKDGTGQVLFVNLPLSYLESRTDGLLMHSFLHYFATDVIGLPYLSAVPNGIGGLIFNWHVDSKAMEPAMWKLMAAGVFDHGPYSIDFSAGPDVDQVGDGKGPDIGHDPETDRLIHDLMLRGHTIGSHGGWIHNYFGEHVSEDNAKEFAKYIQWNINAIEGVTGKPVREYSAPLGNQPEWVSHWLEKHGINSYYFAGDTGMPPTEVFRGSKRDGNDIWAFPIVHLGRYASLEEMSSANLGPQVVAKWLISVADFVSKDRSARLIYSHPVGATKYIGALREFLSHTDQLEGEHRFQWYTMSQLADFLNARKKVQWSLVEKGPNSLLLEAKDPGGLNHETWIFSRNLFKQPKLHSGHAQLSSDPEHWLVTAESGKNLSVEITRK